MDVWCALHPVLGDDLSLQECQWLGRSSWQDDARRLIHLPRSTVASFKDLVGRDVLDALIAIGSPARPTKSMGQGPKPFREPPVRAPRSLESATPSSASHHTSRKGPARQKAPRPSPTVRAIRAVTRLERSTEQLQKAARLSVVREQTRRKLLERKDGLINEINRLIRGIESDPEFDPRSTSHSQALRELRRLAAGAQGTFIPAPPTTSGPSQTPKSSAPAKANVRVFGRSAELRFGPESDNFYTDPLDSK